MQKKKKPTKTGKHDNTLEKNQTTETACERDQMSDLSEKDFKVLYSF